MDYEIKKAEGTNPRPVSPEQTGSISTFACNNYNTASSKMQELHALFVVAIDILQILCKMLAVIVVIVDSVRYLLSLSGRAEKQRVENEIETFIQGLAKAGIASADTQNQSEQGEKPDSSGEAAEEEGDDEDEELIGLPFDDSATPTIYSKLEEMVEAIESNGQPVELRLMPVILDKLVEESGIFGRQYFLLVTAKLGNGAVLAWSILSGSFKEKYGEPITFPPFTREDAVDITMWAIQAFCELLERRLGAMVHKEAMFPVPLATLDYHGTTGLIDLNNQTIVNASAQQE